jgi:hypothetical protein
MIIKGAIQNHIMFIGFNDGLEHFVSAIRKKTDIPIAFYCDQDIYTEVFKLNNIYSNIFHFYGDYFDKSHLEKAAIN